MRRSQGIALAGVLFLSLLQPGAAVACRILSEGELATRQQERLEQHMAEARALYAEADLVFTGRIAKMDITRETIRGAVWHSHSVTFDGVDNIKGELEPNQVLEFKVNRSLVEIGCSIAFRNSLPSENGAGQHYLVYAKARKIVRTNIIVPKLEPLTGDEEADYLRRTNR